MMSSICPSTLPTTLPLSVFSQAGAVHLHPRNLSDLVLHHRGVEYHVHSFVLCVQSAYFRALLAHDASNEDVKPDPDADHYGDGDCRADDSSPRKRRALMQRPLTPSSCDRRRCPHSSPEGVKPCLTLPACGKMDAAPSVFLFFLQHLYHSQHFCFPPAHPSQVVIDALREDAPLTPVYPTSAMALDEVRDYVARDGGCRSLWMEDVLALFSAFECEAALRRCQQVVAWWVSACDSSTIAWLCLTFAARHGLDEAEERCVRLIAQHKRMPSKRTAAVVEAAWRTLRPDLTWRLVRAMSGTLW